MSRPVRNYELIFIVHPEVDDEGLAAVVETVKGLVSRNGGAVVKVDHWGLRRLAYPIKNQWEGQYVFMLLGMDPAGITELERGLVLVEQVIRHSVVRLGDDETPIAKESKAETVVESAEPTAE